MFGKFNKITVRVFSIVFVLQPGYDDVASFPDDQLNNPGDVAMQIPTPVLTGTSGRARPVAEHYLMEFIMNSVN